MKVNSITMRNDSVFRVTLEEIPNNVKTMVEKYLDTNGYEIGDSFVPENGVDGMLIEFEMDIEYPDSCEITYYFDDYESIGWLYADNEEEKVILKVIEDFIKKYKSRIPNNTNLGLGDCEYLELDEVVKINNELANKNENERTFTESEVRALIDKLIKDNDDNFETPDGEKRMDENPYACGIYDGLLDVLNGLNIKTNYEYYMDY